MGRKKNKSTIEIAERVYLKRGSISNCWYYYFALDRTQFRASTKTQDVSKATLIALRTYHEAIDRKRWGISFQKISFLKLSKKYLETLHGQTKQQFHQETIRRHFLGFFEGYEDICEINAGALNDYLIYRRSKTGNTVLNQTLNKENVVFNQMMRLALEYGWIKKPIKFQRQSEAQSHNRRSHFTQEEYDLLIATAKKRINECVMGVSDAVRGRLTNTHWQRFLLHDMIVLLVNTGMRVDEVKSVTWRDISWDNQRITLRSAGKTKSSRIVLVRNEGMDALKSLRERRQAFIHLHKGILEDNERIQSLVNGIFINSMRKGFDDLLAECGFKYQSVKHKHSLTSLRHTYATMRLTSKDGMRATTRSLSKQMGTSQKMIEKHYGHDIVESYRDELLG